MANLRMTAKSALFVLLFVNILDGALTGFAMERHVAEPMAWTYALTVVFSFTSFLWYCRDSDARDFVRSRWLSVAMVSLSFLAIPYYLLRSRPSGQRGRAMLRFAGFAVLLLAVTLGGMLLGAVLA